MPQPPESLPLISIITINYNDGQHLNKTIESVLQQDYPNKEFIVVDGGSTDQSKAIIKTYEHAIDQWVSEKDKGVFDAMNKGLAMAKGDYINFMNAGDWFLTPDAISKVFENVESHQADLVYGNHEVHYPNFIKKKKALPLHFLWKHMTFSHQALFTKRELLIKHPFDLNFKIAADFNFIFNAYLNGYTFYYADVAVAGYLAGGQSEAKVIEAYLENKKIVFAHKPSLNIRLFHYALLAKQIPIVLLRKLLPKAWFLKLMQLKNWVTSST